jgi:hypothetical protein
VFKKPRPVCVDKTARERRASGQNDGQDKMEAKALQFPRDETLHSSIRLFLFSLLLPSAFLSNLSTCSPPTLRLTCLRSRELRLESCRLVGSASAPVSSFFHQGRPRAFERALQRARDGEREETARERGDERGKERERKRECVFFTSIAPIRSIHKRAVLCAATRTSSPAYTRACMQRYDNVRDETCAVFPSLSLSSFLPKTIRLSSRKRWGGG